MTETQLTLLEQNGRVLAYVPAIFMNGYGLQAGLDPGAEKKSSGLRHLRSQLLRLVLLWTVKSLHSLLLQRKWSLAVRDHTLLAQKSQRIFLRVNASVSRKNSHRSWFLSHAFLCKNHCFMRIGHRDHRRKSEVRGGVSRWFHLAEGEWELSTPVVALRDGLEEQQ